MRMTINKTCSSCVSTWIFNRPSLVRNLLLLAGASQCLT
jgi:hypothetical protein